MIREKETDWLVCSVRSVTSSLAFWTIRECQAHKETFLINLHPFTLLLIQIDREQNYSRMIHTMKKKERR